MSAEPKVPRPHRKDENKRNIATNSGQKGKIDWIVFLPPILLILAFCVWIIANSEGAGIALNKAYSFVTVTLGWFFEWYAVALFAVFLYFVLGPYAKIKLGEGDPEFKTSTWWGMMFTTNAGVGVLFWATMESFWTSQAGPFGSEPLSAEAARWAVAYPMYHWGPMAWAMYTAFGLAFAYFFWVKKMNVARPSTPLVLGYSSECFPVICWIRSTRDLYRSLTS